MSGEHVLDREYEKAYGIVHERVMGLFSEYRCVECGEQVKALKDSSANKLKLCTKCYMKKEEAEKR